jgi:hypothetical protein
MEHHAEIHSHDTNVEGMTYKLSSIFRIIQTYAVKLLREKTVN